MSAIRGHASLRYKRRQFDVFTSGFRFELCQVVRQEYLRDLRLLGSRARSLKCLFVLSLSVRQRQMTNHGSLLCLLRIPRNGKYKSYSGQGEYNRNKICVS